MESRIQQSGNTLLNGDLVGGDKIDNLVIVKKEVARAAGTLRTDLAFSPECDDSNTVLKAKLEKGKFNKVAKAGAIRAKVETLGVLLSICKSEEGKRKVADIYENLLTLINTRFVSQLDDGELLKTKMKDFTEAFSELVIKYQDLVNIDEAFLEGLLYIATSNCAIMWKMEDIS